MRWTNPRSAMMSTRAGAYSGLRRPALAVCLGVACALAISTWCAADDDLTDGEIKAAVELDLLRDDAVPFHLVDVEIEEGIVTLSGSVDNILARDRAIGNAKSIKGVRAVVDKMTVAAVDRPDDELRSDVEQALMLDPATDSYEVSALVQDGAVTLTGVVDSWAEKQLAAQVVKGVKGTRRVVNDITVFSKAERPDDEIEIEVERRLEADTFVRSDLIQVDVEDGKVMLSGSVGSASERTHAYTDAWVAGVTEVDASELEVNWWAWDEARRKSRIVEKTDDEIQEAVKDALFYDPRVFSFDVDVEVEDGTATLRGVVDNAEAKRVAERDARHTLGIYRVTNLLKVRPEKQPSDSEIAEDVRQALVWNPIVERHELTVAVRNGTVYLYGRVDSQYEKKEAEDVAYRINGVIHVENKLEIRDTWTWKSDEEIREDIEGELFWSFFVDSGDITVTVENGTATLTGQVDSWNEFESAIENAYQGGALSVRSRMTIRDVPVYYHGMYGHPSPYYWR